MASFKKKNVTPFSLLSLDNFPGNFNVNFNISLEQRSFAFSWINKRIDKIVSHLSVTAYHISMFGSSGMSNTECFDGAYCLYLQCQVVSLYTETA